MRRDAWIVGNEMGTAIMNLNSLFCEKDGDTEDPQICTQNHIDEIVEMINEKCTKMSLEDALVVLTRAMELKK